MSPAPSTDVLATVLLVIATCCVAALAFVYAVTGYLVPAAVLFVCAAISARAGWAFWRDVRADGTDTDRSDR